MTLVELQSLTKRLGMPGFAAKQIASWLYEKKVASIDDMTNLSLKHRELLKQNYEVGAEAPVDEMRSVDGTVKYLYKVGENHFVESVYIPDDDRATLCVSSQVGCKMNCKFCMTGKQGYTANLTASQIINQIHSLPERDKLTNVVMMGMGEPLDNLDEVLKALELLTATYGYAWSPKRITLSTVGLRKGLQRFIEENDCHLAISLYQFYHLVNESKSSVDNGLAGHILVYYANANRLICGCDDVFQSCVHILSCNTACIVIVGGCSGIYTSFRGSRNARVEAYNWNTCCFRCF